MADRSNTTKLWEDYQKGMSYQSAMGFDTLFPKCVDFYEGRQWAKATDNTKGMPRPVVNFIKMIARNKKGNILAIPVHTVYKSMRGGEVTGEERFNRFSDFVMKELKIARIDDEAMEDGVVKGTYAEHFYWDTESNNTGANRAGGLRCEIVDPLRLFFANPQERDEQKQKWIIIASREEVSSVRMKADKGVNPDDIVADSYNEKYSETKEQEDDELVTVLLRYFRKDGEVWWERATQSCVVNEPRRLTPDAESVLRQIRGEDKPSAEEDRGEVDDSGAPEDDSMKSDGRGRCYLYPIVVGQYDRRQGSIYGIGEVENLIPNQKVVNFTLGMQALNIQNNAWGKYVVLPGALDNQKINNNPGQILVDKTGTGNGIKKMPEQTLHTEVTNVVDAMISMSRSVSGATEVMSGETLGANMSGAAIAELQTQARVPVKVLQDAFWRFKERQGEVLAQFFKLYYGDTPFFYEDKDEQGNEITIEDIFNSSAYTNIDFEVVCEASAGANASTAGDITALDTLFNKGAIDVDSYIDAYPDDALSNKSELKEGVKKTRDSTLAQLTEQLSQAQAQAAQLADIVERQNKSVESVTRIIQENKQLRETLAQLYAESYAKISAQNQELNAMRADASDMAAMLVQSGLVKPAQGNKEQA